MASLTMILAGLFMVLFGPTMVHFGNLDDELDLVLNDHTQKGHLKHILVSDGLLYYGPIIV